VNITKSVSSQEKNPRKKKEMSDILVEEPAKKETYRLKGHDHSGRGPRQGMIN